MKEAEEIAFRQLATDLGATDPMKVAQRFVLNLDKARAARVGQEMEVMMTRHGGGEDANRATRGVLAAYLLKEICQQEPRMRAALLSGVLLMARIMAEGDDLDRLMAS